MFALVMTIKIVSHVIRKRINTDNEQCSMDSYFTAKRHCKYSTTDNYILHSKVYVIMLFSIYF